MQFMLIGYDGTDEGAPARRQAARDAHIALGTELAAQGHVLFGTVLLDDDGKVNGSMLVLDYPSRDDLDKWLTVEPNAVSGVWETITVTPIMVGPAFLAPRP